MAAATPGYPAGFEKCILWKPKGKYAAGQKGDTLANGDVSPAWVISDVISASINYQAPTVLPIRGGDRQVATFLFGNPALGQFDLEMSIFDPDMIASLSETDMDDSANSEYQIVSNNTFKSKPTFIGMALTQRYQPKTTGADSNDLYHTLIIPRASCTVHYAPMNYQAEYNTTISVVPTTTNALHNGIPFSGTTLDLADDRTDSYSMITDAPIHIMTCQGAASTGTLTFTTTYLPTSAVATISASPNWLTVDGVVNTLTSVSVTTGVVVIPASPDHIGPGEIGVFTYQTRFATA